MHSVSGQTREGTAHVLRDLPEISKRCVPGRFSLFPAYSTASTNDVYAIVGDLKGMQVNFPEGDGMTIKYDDLTKKTLDIIEVLGRMFAAHGITKLSHFVNIRKPAAGTTT